MTPKQKAKELVNKFRIHQPVWEVKDDAKKCALIAVDEILKSGCTLPSDNAYYGDNEEASKYWLKVKQEIEKL